MYTSLGAQLENHLAGERIIFVGQVEVHLIKKWKGSLSLSLSLFLWSQYLSRVQLFLCLLRLSVNRYYSLSSVCRLIAMVVLNMNKGTSRSFIFHLARRLSSCRYRFVLRKPADVSRLRESPRSKYRF